MSAPPPDVGALAVRAALWPLLSGCEPSPAAWARAAGAGPLAWRLFLSVEGCALPVAERLGRPGGAFALPPEVEAVLRERSVAELKRVLSARAQLVSLGRMAREHGWMAIVLKGGVAAMGMGERVDLSDVDVLLPDAQARALAALLDARGFRATEADPAPGETGWPHLAQRVAPDGLAVEIHYGIPEVELDEGAWGRAVAFASQPGLARLSPAEHAWHVLVHSAVSHPSRRGRFRDVLLLADALRECAAGEVEAMRARAAASPFAGPLLGVLEAACAVRDGTPVPDRFARVAAGSYVLAWRLGRVRLPGSLATPLHRVVFALLGDPADRARGVGSALVFRRRSQVAAVAGVERSPLASLGVAARLPWRLLRYAVAGAMALPVALLARRAVRRGADAEG